MNVTVVGAGAWGTALAILLHHNRHAVTLWGHDANHLEEIGRIGRNRRHLPDVPLPEGWRFESNLPEALQGAEVVVMAVPSRAFREIAVALAGFTGPIVSV